MDSIFISDLAADCGKDRSVYDIGTGAGFPGIVFAIRFPERSITLFEKSLKKLSFLTAAIAQLGLKNVTVQGAASDEKSSGVFLARAVFPRDELFKFMRRRMVDGSFLVTNLGGTNPVKPPPAGFHCLKEISYLLPLDCGPRKAEILEFVSRGTKSPFFP